MTKNKVLFLYISISSGHQKAAEAMNTALNDLDTQTEGLGIDLFTRSYPRLGKVFAKAYLKMLEHAPQIWDYLYDNPDIEEATREVREILNRLNARKLQKLIRLHRPKALVCTQAAPASVAASEKKKGNIDLPLIGVITDYGVHSYWLYEQMDLYLAPTEEVKREIVRRGIPESKVRITGIPIDPHFAEHYDPQEERRRLRLSPHRPTVLIMGGSKGLGPMNELVAAVRNHPAQPQLIVVCGQNRETFRELHEEYEGDSRVRLIGWEKNVSRLMDASDVLISKPGGLTSAEALAKGLPLIMCRPIPGQEERNADYLTRNGVALRADDLSELDFTLGRLFDHPDQLKRMSEKARFLGRPRAAWDAARYILGLARQKDRPSHSTVPPPSTVPWALTR